MAHSKGVASIRVSPHQAWLICLIFHVYVCNVAAGWSTPAGVRLLTPATTPATQSLSWNHKYNPENLPTAAHLPSEETPSLSIIKQLLENQKRRPSRLGPNYNENTNKSIPTSPPNLLLESTQGPLSYANTTMVPDNPPSPNPTTHYSTVPTPTTSIRQEPITSSSFNNHSPTTVQMSPPERINDTNQTEATPCQWRDIFDTPDAAVWACLTLVTAYIAYNVGERKALKTIKKYQKITSEEPRPTHFEMNGMATPSQLPLPPPPTPLVTRPLVARH